MNQAIFTSSVIIIVAALIIYFIWKRRSDGTKSGGTSSLLAMYSRDLTQLAKEGKLDPVIGRHREISRLVQILSRRMKNNPILIGKSGIGKTAIVEELANLIAAGQVPDSLKYKRVLQLDLSGLIAGTKYRGEFEKRLQSIVNEIRAARRNIILFIDEVHILAEAGEASGAINAADILKPALSRGDLQAIGATTLVEYQNSIEKDRTLKRRFQPITVEESTPEETMKILFGIRKRYNDYHHVDIDDNALKAAVEMTQKTIPGRHYPDKAIDAIDEAAAKVHLEQIISGTESSSAIPKVTAKDVEEIIREWDQDQQTFDRLTTMPSASEIVEAQKEATQHAAIKALQDRAAAEAVAKTEQDSGPTAESDSGNTPAAHQ